MTLKAGALLGKWDIQVGVLVLLLAASLAACAPDAERPRVDSGACYSAAAEVAVAWAELVGDMPDECLDAFEAYSLVVVPEVPCEDGGERALGCTFHDPRTIYLDASMDEDLTVDLAAHEWVHVYARCVYGDGDRHHANPALWTPTMDGVWGRAALTAPLGPCL